MVLVRGSCTAAVIKVDNAAFQAGFSKWLKSREQIATMAYRGLVAELYTYVVEETPQYTGESVSNWRMDTRPVYVSVGAQQQAYKAAAGKHTPYGKLGHPAGPGKGSPAAANLSAIAVAKQSMMQLVPNLKLDQVVCIANGTVFDGHGGINVTHLEKGGWLRAVNEPGRMLEGGLSWIQSGNTATWARLKALIK
jgi:hypothetical protein